MIEAVTPDPDYSLNEKEKLLKDLRRYLTDPLLRKEVEKILEETKPAPKPTSERLKPAADETKTKLSGVLAKQAIDPTLAKKLEYINTLIGDEAYKVDGSLYLQMFSAIKKSLPKGAPDPRPHQIFERLHQAKPKKRLVGIIHDIRKDASLKWIRWEGYCSSPGEAITPFENMGEGYFVQTHDGYCLMIDRKKAIIQCDPVKPKI
jgi:hypothetical protein